MYRVHFPTGELWNVVARLPETRKLNVGILNYRFGFRSFRVKLIIHVYVCEPISVHVGRHMCYIKNVHETHNSIQPIKSGNVNLTNLRIPLHRANVNVDDEFETD